MQHRHLNPPPKKDSAMPQPNLSLICAPPSNDLCNVGRSVCPARNEWVVAEYGLGA